MVARYKKTFNGINSHKNTIYRRVPGLAIPLIILIIIAVFAVGICMFFRVAEIEVTGSFEKTSAEEIISYSQISVGDSMIFTRSRKAESSIMNGLIYISNATIRKEYPAKIIIEITEKGSVACIALGEDTWLLDSDMRVLEKAESDMRGKLLVLRGFSEATAIPGEVLKVSEGDLTKLHYAAEVLSALEEQNMFGRIKTLDMTNIAGITFDYLGRFNVYLGSGENAVLKLARIGKIVENIGAYERGTIDLSGDEKSYFIPYGSD